MSTSDDSELKEIKTLISSLLVSNPNKSTVRSLERDFREEIGYSIPFRKFGYPSMDSFLRSIPDTVNVLGSGSHAIVQVLVSTKVAHIDDLISKQRSTGKKKSFRQNSSRFYGNYTRPVPRPAYRPPSLAYEPPRPLFESPIYSYGTTTQASHQVIERYSNGVSCSTTAGQNSSQPYLMHRPPSSSASDRFSASSKSSKASSQSTKAQASPLALKSNATREKNVLKLDKSETSSSTRTDKNLASNFNQLSVQEGFGAVPSGFKVPHDVQTNLLRIVSDYPNGVDCSMVPSIYRKTYKSELDYCKYGYRNLIQLLRDFPNTYYCIRPDNGDYKIFDKSRPLPENLDSLNETEKVESSGFGKNQNKSLIFPDSALPANMYNTLTIEYPPDVLKLKEIIPRQFVSESTMEMHEIELHVGEVYDPSKFWIILKEDFKDLQELMNEMQMHYSYEYDKLKIDEQYLEAGMFCVAIYGKLYHRALLTKVTLSNHTANVFYIDYGTIETISSKDLYFLTNKFAYLPQLAIRARLTGIKPPENQMPWSLQTTLKFLTFVQYRLLKGKIHHIDREEQILDIVLIDESRPKHFVINDALVNAQLAIFANQVPRRRRFSLYVPSVDPIHLFPTFHELENFLVASLSEFREKARLNISHDKIYPEYYQIGTVPVEDSDSDQSISAPVKRRQHLKEILSNTNNEIETTEEIQGLSKVLKPPPGFKIRPQSLINTSTCNNVKFDPVSSNVPTLGNNSSSQLLLKHEKTNNNLAKNATISYNQEITRVITSSLKKGNVVILYLLTHFLKEYSIDSEVSKNLLKYLKKKYITLPPDVLEEMIGDVLDDFTELHLLKLCESIKISVPEFQYKLPHKEKYNYQSSESLQPFSSPSSSPSLDLDLSPFAMSFVPSTPLIPQFPPHLKLSPILEPQFIKPSLIPLSSSVCNQDSEMPNSSVMYNSNQPKSNFSPNQQLSPIATQTLSESPKHMCEESNHSSAYNPIETPSETSTMYSSKQYNSMQQRSKFVFKKKLHGNVVHLINLNEQIYITILEIQELIKLKDISVETIKKNISLCDGAQFLHEINLEEHEQLKEELQRFGLEYDDKILNLIKIEFIPEFITLFGNIVFPKSSFKKFLKEVYYKSDEASGNSYFTP